MPVFPAGGPTAICTLADAMSMLSMTQVPTDGGVLLQQYIDGARLVVEDIIGHVVPVQVVETHDGGDVSIYLREPPILTVDQVIEVIGMTRYTLTNQPVGTPVDNFAYTINDRKNGRITRRTAGSTPTPFYKNIENITVTYTAGLAAVAPNVKQGALELVAHMWRFGHQAYGPSNAFVPIVAQEMAEEWSTTPSGYLVPNRVKEMLQPSTKPIVFS